MESRELAALRAEYALAGLDDADAGDDPVVLLNRWMREAIEGYAATASGEPNAMALATADERGRPAVRMVLLKGLDAEGAVFYTNLESRKGRELQANPWAAAVLPWHPLQRQVRIEGRVTPLDEPEVDAYFAARPRGAQLAAAASEQSASVTDRAELERRYAEAESRFEGGPVPRPLRWGGYRMALEVVEFWQGRPNRLHDRIRFTLTGQEWVRERLQP
ncbi:MAG TPA: pyridoxamine 5'-phosphate oxidase [Aeromicrobium sp.]|nr:pyridoxamine 5'-phosphate oxidase [Aeromicrobium sp.]